jgi:hypothetical protein
MFLKYCCGYTNFYEDVAATGSFDSYEATGSNGSFSGAARPVGSIATIASASHVNGEKLTLDDGYNVPTEFTFSTSPSADTDIDITGAVSADVMRDRIIAAVNLIAADEGALWLDATSGGAATVTLTHWRYHDRGNVTSWTETVTNSGFVLTQPTGGLNGWVLEEKTTTPFVINQDEEKFVLIVDPTNDVNNGWYMIRRVISTSKVELDFKAAGDNGEAFTAVASGLTWYMTANDFEIPSTNGDLFRLDSPSAQGWSIEIARAETFFDETLSTRVAVNGNWGGGKIIGPTEFETSVEGHRAFLCMELDTDGTYMNIWMTSEWHDRSLQRQTAIMIDEISKIDPEFTADESVIIVGPGTAAAGYTPFNRNNTVNEMGHIYMWNEELNEQIDAWMVDLSVANNYQGITGSSGASYPEGNRRLNRANYSWEGPLNEVFDGTLIIKDPATDTYPQNHFELVGWTNGHLVVKNFSLRGPDAATDLDYKPLRKNVQINFGGDKNKIASGPYMFNWPPGITKQRI